LKIANRTSKLAKIFADGLKSGGYKLHSENYFDTVTITTNEKTDTIDNKALSEKINLRIVEKNTLSVSFDEIKRVDHVNTLLQIFGVKKMFNNTDTLELTNLP
jgi:Glycine cleavage system protein P (pyridoxal-binding), N-terminal domain